MKARSAKSKGARLENDVVKALKAAGIQARRQPGSGIYSDFPHDIEMRLDGRRYIVECKARKEGHRTLDGWLGKADVLVIKADRGEVRVYMSLSVLTQMLQGEQDV